MTGQTGLFITGVFAIAILVGLLLSNGSSKGRVLSYSIFVMLIISILSSIGLGINYLAAFTGRQDGIGLTGWLARLIIGDDSWSVALFLSYFEGAMTSSVLLLFVYMAAIISENKAQHKLRE